MDISGANRTAAVIAASLPMQAVAAPAVAGNGKTDDLLVSRVAAEPETTSGAGDGDNSELRARHSGSSNQYSNEELAHLQDLRARDREVRAHEMAHLAAAGSHSRGGASFTFETGPDGRRYAVAGEVGIDTSEVAGDPVATLAKAQQVRRAALAPADPSPQDRQIAAQAAAMAAQASAEIAQQRQRPEDQGVSAGVAVNKNYSASTETVAPTIELFA